MAHWKLGRLDAACRGFQIVNLLRDSPILTMSALSVILKTLGDAGINFEVTPFQMLGVIRVTPFVG